LFGLAAKWKKPRPDRLTRLAGAIEAIGEQDRKLVEEIAAVERLRAKGAVVLHAMCRDFVDSLNGRLSTPVVVLAPWEYSSDNYRDAGHNLFQINLRGRLLQVEFTATGELYSTEDFPRPYILHGSIRSFNQDFLDHSELDEQSIFCCAKGENAVWHYLDRRTYRTGTVTRDFLAAELERLI